MAFRNQVGALSQLVADSITGATITGGIFRTAATGKRWELTSAIRNKLLGYSGLANESEPGAVLVDALTDDSGVFVSLQSGKLAGSTKNAWLDVLTENLFGPVTTAVTVHADQINMQGDHGKTASLSSAGFKFAGAGRGISRFDFGTNVLTTNAASEIVISHGLGAVPLGVVALPNTLHQLRLATTSATTFTLSIRTTAGALVGGGVTVNAYWIAIA